MPAPHRATRGVTAPALVIAFPIGALDTMAVCSPSRLPIAVIVAPRGRIIGASASTHLECRRTAPRTGSEPPWRTVAELTAKTHAAIGMQLSDEPAHEWPVGGRFGRRPPRGERDAKRRAVPIDRRVELCSARHDSRRACHRRRLLIARGMLAGTYYHGLDRMRRGSRARRHAARGDGVDDERCGGGQAVDQRRDGALVGRSPRRERNAERLAAPIYRRVDLC